MKVSVATRVQVKLKRRYAFSATLVKLDDANIPTDDEIDAKNFESPEGRHVWFLGVKDQNYLSQSPPYFTLARSTLTEGSRYALTLSFGFAVRGGIAASTSTHTSIIISTNIPPIPGKIYEIVMSYIAND